MSRRAYTPNDLPWLRTAREAYRGLIARGEALRATEDDLGSSVAASLVLDELHAAFHAYGVLLTRVEKLRPGQSVRGRIPAAPEQSSMATKFRQALQARERKLDQLAAGAP
jgi:hypothetical protein